MTNFSEWSQLNAVNAGSGNSIIHSINGNLINLNQVFQTTLESYNQGLLYARPVVRCDTLPFAPGDSTDYLKLFNLVFKMIILNKPVSGNVFIYIKSEQKEAVQTVRGLKIFSISVYSNTPHIKECVNDFQQELNECKAICAQFNGSFQEHLSSESGCLFTLTLPGTLN